jgi:hypothetical protein
MGTINKMTEDQFLQSSRLFLKSIHSVTDTFQAEKEILEEKVENLVSNFEKAKKYVPLGLAVASGVSAFFIFRSFKTAKIAHAAVLMPRVTKAQIIHGTSMTNRFEEFASELGILTPVLFFVKNELVSQAQSGIDAFSKGFNRGYASQNKMNTK